MKLSNSQLAQFERDGYLFFPSQFSPAEVKVLTDAVPGLYAQRRPENVREKTGDVVRTNFAAHMYSAPFARLARHPRMVAPVEQILGEKLYMHQFKINGKMAFDGDVWQWHQDFGTWTNDDAMPEARAMNVAIFLDEVNEFNGPEPDPMIRPYSPQPIRAIPSSPARIATSRIFRTETRPPAVRHYPGPRNQPRIRSAAFRSTG